MSQEWKYYESCTPASKASTDEENNAQARNIVNVTYDDRDDDGNDVIDVVVDEGEDDDDDCEAVDGDCDVGLMIAPTVTYSGGSGETASAANGNGQKKRGRSPSSLMPPPPSPRQTKRRAAEYDGRVADGGGCVKRRTVRGIVDAIVDDKKKAKKTDDPSLSRCEDENYQFLMSLLPYLRDVPRHRKLAVRHRLQKVLVDEQDHSNRAANRHADYSPVTIHHRPIPARPPPPYPYAAANRNFEVPSSHTPASSVGTFVTPALATATATAAAADNRPNVNFSLQTFQDTNLINYDVVTAGAAVAGTSIERLDQIATWTYLN